MMKTEDDRNQEPKPVVIKTAVDLQKMKLEKLMKNPEKPVLIPERQKEKKLPHVPEFVRNVMGSSAGAGSGEFHVYRHLRRKEYARQRYIQERGEKSMLDEAYEQKIIENKKMAEERTQKKRQKRMKKKAKKLKRNRSEKPNENSQGAQDDGDSTDKDSDNSEVSDNAK